MNIKKFLFSKNTHNLDVFNAMLSAWVVSSGYILTGIVLFTLSTFVCETLRYFLYSKGD